MRSNLKFGYKLGDIKGIILARSLKEAKRKALADYLIFSVIPINSDLKLSFTTSEPFSLKEELEYRIKNNLGTEADLLDLTELQEIINQLQEMK